MDKPQIERVWKEFVSSRSPEIKSRLAAHYFEFVQHIANNLAQKLNWKVPVEELASYGTDGLFSAIEAYDLERKIKFETYAYRRIQGSMIDAMRSEDWVPRSVRQRQDQIEQCRETMEAHFGDRVSTSQVLQQLNICEKDFHKNPSKYKASMKSSIENCINPEVESDNKKDFNKYLVCKKNSSPEGKIVRREFLSKLMGKHFSSLERKIIYFYYYEDLTMKEISKKLNISESRISQLHQQVLKRLRAKIAINPEYFDEDVISVMSECHSRGSLFS
jgi:RNA polymerase sigma factor for flagellar operon FliA